MLSSLVSLFSTTNYHTHKRIRTAIIQFCNRAAGSHGNDGEDSDRYSFFGRHYSIGRARVEAGSNTSNVARRVVGGDKNGTQCLGHPVPGDINKGNWPSRLGESRISDSKLCHESHETRTREWLRWRGPAAIVNDRPILSSKRMLHKDYDRKCSVGKENCWSRVSRGLAPRGTDWR
jgi:hypothetical protein